MTTATSAGAPAPSVQPYPGSRYHLTFGRVLSSEWVKFRSLRSTLWTLLITVVVMVGFTALIAAVWRSNIDSISQDPDAVGLGGVDALTIGVNFAQLAIAVLGALTIAGEYSTGMIRSTFSMVPRRTPALLAKALLVALVTFVVTGVATVISYLVAVPFLSGTVFALDLSDASTLRVLVGIPLYLSAIAVLAMGVGALVRNSAGAIFSLVALLLVIPGVFSGVPLKWMNTLAEYLPSQAGNQLLTANPTGSLSSWAGFGVMVVWAVVAFGAAVVIAKRRDA